MFFEFIIHHMVVNKNNHQLMEINVKMPIIAAAMAKNAFLILDYSYFFSSRVKTRGRHEPLCC